MPEPVDMLRQGLSLATRLCHDRAIANGWWSDPSTGARIRRNKGELLALMHSEISECLEGERKGLMDDHLPNRRAAEVELADLLIRVFDYAGEHGYDLGNAVAEKLAYNDARLDHRPDQRRLAGGKAF
jgi:NTP pyrophosphatase (non-canonical NTP hydrolase)